MSTIKTTKEKLSDALFYNSDIVLGNIHLVLVSCIEHEDGSGTKFNVTGRNEYGEKVTIFVQV